MASKLLASALYMWGMLLVSSSDIPEGALNLLQASVEVKKGQARVAEQAPEEEADYGSEFSSCGAGICGGTKSPGSLEVALPEEVQEKGPELKQEADPAQEASSFITLGTLLQAVACLLIGDVLRRGQFQGKTSNSPAVQISTTKASATSVAPASLLTAALSGDHAAFEAQISSSLSQLSRVDSWGCSVLHYAAKGGSVKIIKKLLDLGSRIDALDAWDETPLHLAARAGHTEACEFLLTSGADIDSTNAEECTPLVVAGRENHKAICTMLVERGAGVAGLPEDEVPALVTELLKQEAM